MGPADDLRQLAAAAPDSGGLTRKAISNKLATMNSDLDSLEQKIEQVLALCAHLSGENHGLRDQIATLEQHNQFLIARSETARERLEALVERLPAE